VLLPVAAWTAFLIGSRCVVALTIVSVLIIAPAAWLMGAASRGGYIRLESFACPSWEIFSPECLIENFGILLPLLIWLAVDAANGVWRRGAKWSEWSWDDIASLYFPLVFILCLVVSFSPWPWDNTKFMIWSVVATAPLVWSRIIARFPGWFRIFVIILLIAPGVGSLGTALSPQKHGYRIASSSSVREALYAKSLVPPDSVLAAAPEYSHPWFLAGHAFFLGYEGWLWSHGLKSSEKRGILMEVLSGGHGWESAALGAGITHVVWSDLERRLTGNSTHPASGEWPEVFRSEGTSIYAAPNIGSPR
jgi:hypothetical protein